MPDIHKMISTVLKTTFQKEQPNKIFYRNFKSFELHKFKSDIKTKMQPVDRYKTLKKEMH